MDATAAAAGVRDPERRRGGAAPQSGAAAAGRVVGRRRLPARTVCRQRSISGKQHCINTMPRVHMRAHTTYWCRERGEFASADSRLGTFATPVRCPPVLHSPIRAVAERVALIRANHLSSSGGGGSASSMPLPALLFVVLSRPCSILPCPASSFYCRSVWPVSLMRVRAERRAAALAPERRAAAHTSGVRLCAASLPPTYRAAYARRMLLRADRPATPAAKTTQVGGRGSGGRPSAVVAPAGVGAARGRWRSACVGRGGCICPLLPRLPSSSCVWPAPCS